MPSPSISYYFDRFGFCPRQIGEPPHPNLGISVVIPCFNEPNLLASLQSLWRCARPEAAVEIIVVINSGENAPLDILAQNRRTLEEATAWAREDCDRHFRVHLLHFPDLPRKHAGVGLARKIGMDEALRRFDAVNRLDGIIACFDADSTCDPNYLVELERFFAIHPKSPGCSIYFEHPIEPTQSPSPVPSALSASSANSALLPPPDPKIYQAVTLYELHLRYYVEALRFARFPHAFHTIGSSMAVRADAYMKQGGMNRRLAGEDFYFLHKIIPLGHFGEINTTRIIPSPRPSDRVPFGTGRAIRDYLQTGQFETYPLQAFRDLNHFFKQIPFAVPPSGGLPPPLQDFLAKQNFPQALDEIRRNTSTPDAFRKRFFRWFDGFQAMKYIHHARDTAYGPTDIAVAARELLGIGASSESRELVLRFRQIQRGAPPP